MINFKLTSCLLLGGNKKIDNNINEEFLCQQLYRVAFLVKVDEPPTRNILRPYRRESSQHQEFELNQPASKQPLHNNEVGHVLSIIEGPTGKYIFKKVHSPQISSTHLFEQAISTSERTLMGTSSLRTLTLTTNIIHSKEATTTIKYSDDMEVDLHQRIRQDLDEPVSYLVDINGTVNIFTDI